MKKIFTIMSTVALFTVCSAAYPSNPEGIELQRLFTTPDERAAIDAQLSAAPPSPSDQLAVDVSAVVTDDIDAPTVEQSVIPDNFPIFYHGSFGRQQASTVWINQTLINVTQFSDVLQLNHETRELLVFLGPEQRWVPVKAGQILYLKEKIITDRMQEGMDANTTAVNESLNLAATPLEQPELQPEFISLLRSHTL